MSQSDTAQRLAQIEAALQRVEAALSALVPPKDVRASMEEATVHQDAMADAAPLQRTQLADIAEWLHQRMSGDQLQFQFDDLLFVTKQLISLWHGARDEQVLMRADIRRLAALCEQALRARVDDEERALRGGGGD